MKSTFTMMTFDLERGLNNVITIRAKATDVWAAGAALLCLLSAREWPQ